MKYTVHIFAPILAALLTLSATTTFADGRDKTEKTKKADPKMAKKYTPAKKSTKAAKPQPKKSAGVKRTVKPPSTMAKAVNPVTATQTDLAAEKPSAPEHRSAVNKPAAKEAPPPQIAFVLFESAPANAEVVIDGLYAGSTPIQLPVKEGAHGVKLIYPGYNAWERQIKAYRGMHIMATLEQAKTDSSQK